MKKAFVFAMVMSMMASALFAANPKPIVKTEYLVFKISYNAPATTRVRDEKGSEYLHIDYISKTTCVVVKCEYKKEEKYGRVHETKNATNLHLSSSNSINGSGMSQSTFAVLNPNENSNKGAVCFQVGLSGTGEGLASATCELAGLLDVEWNEEEQRYVVTGGEGFVSGSNYPSPYEAYAYLTSATHGGMARKLPIWGTFTVKRYGDIPTEQVKRLIKGEDIEQ